MKGRTIRWEEAVLLNSNEIYIWHSLVLVCLSACVKGKEILLPDFVRTISLGIKLTSSSTIHIWEFLAKSGPSARWEGCGIEGELCSDIFWGSCTVVGWARMDVTHRLIMVHKPGRENALKMFAGGKKKEECSCSRGLARLYKTPRINVAVEQAVTPHEKSFSKGTKAILFYLYCWLKSASTVATKLCTF